MRKALFILFASAFALGLRAADTDSLPADIKRQFTPDYRLAPRDLVQVQVYEDPDTIVIQRIPEAGKISVTMIGDVLVKGLTVREAEQAIAKAYVAGGFFIKPQVIISIQAYAPRSVSVMGQVNKPDNIQFPVERDELGIIQAITLAGGLTRIAKSESVLVIRSVDGKEQQFTVNISAYFDSKASGQGQFVLKPDDIVYVPERFL